MCLHRAVGDRDFSAREVRLMRFFHNEVGRLIRGPLVSGLERWDVEFEGYKLGYDFPAGSGSALMPHSISS
jgi:hypothetical protein